MLRSQMCASSESENRKFSKTDYLDIAVYGEQQPDGNLHPIVFELLSKARELADQTSVKVALVVIGNQISRKARDFFRFGADRIFVYDDPIYTDLSMDVAHSVFDHFIDNYKPSVILFGETDDNNNIAHSVLCQNEAAYACRQSNFSIRSNKDLDFSSSSPCEKLIQITAFRPQIVSVPAGSFRPLIPDFSHKGELVLCEQPASMNHQEKNGKNEKIT